MSKSADVIQVPTYLLGDDQLLAMATSLIGFASGHADFTDKPCPRAATALKEIERELEARQVEWSRDKDGKFRRRTQ